MKQMDKTFKNQIIHMDEVMFAAAVAAQCRLPLSPCLTYTMCIQKSSAVTRRIYAYSVVFEQNRTFCATVCVIL